MSRVKKFQDFLNEDNSTPEIISDKNNMTITDVHIKEFQSKKSTISNIYNTYKDEKDLINKLNIGKFISKGTNINDVMFINPLLGMWALSCQKRREVTTIQQNITKWNQEITQKTQFARQNPSSAEVTNAEIQELRKKISESQKSLSSLSQEVSSLEKQANNRLSSMKKELTDSQKRNSNMP